MKLRINLNYYERKTMGEVLSEKEKATNQQKTFNMIQTAIHMRYKDGVDDSLLRRTIAHIQEKLDEGLDNLSDYIEFENAEVETIEKCLKEAKLPAGWSRDVVMLQDEIEKTRQKENEKKKNEKVSKVQKTV